MIRNNHNLTKEEKLLLVDYRIVASTSPSRIEAHADLFRSLMKGIFDPYVLWPFAKKLQNWIVDWSTAHDFTVRNLDYINF